MSIKIITDSASDLPKEIYDEYDVEVLSLLVYMDENEYRDGVDVQPTQLFKFMKDGGSPSTTQVPYGVFHRKIRELAEKGGSYIYIAFSSQLSGTYQTAKLVESEIKEEYPDFDFQIIDSRSASLGFGFIVRQAAIMAKEGRGKKEIINTIEFYINHLEHIFTVDNIEYLYRGGRVSKTAAIVGSVLNIKPILDVQDGKLMPIEKVRGRKKTLHRVVDIIGERGECLQEQIIGINHADDIQTAENIKSLIEQKYNVKEFIINDVGSTIGSHTGPGVIGVYFLNKWPVL